MADRRETDDNAASATTIVTTKQVLKKGQYCGHLVDVIEEHGQEYWDLPPVPKSERQDMLETLTNDFQSKFVCLDEDENPITDIKHYREKVRDRLKGWKKNRDKQHEKKGMSQPRSVETVLEITDEFSDLSVEAAAMDSDGASSIGRSGSKTASTSSTTANGDGDNLSTGGNSLMIPSRTTGGRVVDALLMKKLEYFCNHFLLSGSAQEYVQSLVDSANDDDKDDDDKSYKLINQAVEIHLTDDEARGYARAYNEMVTKYPSNKKHLVLTPAEWIQLAQQSALQKDPTLSKRTTDQCTNLALLIGLSGGKPRGPQPTHIDTVHPMDGSEPEKFCILMLSKDCPGTIAYDMKGVPNLPSLSEIRHRVWKDAPASLWNSINDNQQALKLIRECGRLLFATSDKRREPGIVPQFDLTILTSSHPHCAPACDQLRSVLFFTLGEGYNGNVQYSREKLAFLLYEELRESENVRPEELQYLLHKFLQYYTESAQFGAKDTTFEAWPESFEKTLEKLNTLVEEDRINQNEILVAEEQFEHAKANLQLAKAMGQKSKQKVNDHIMNAGMVMQGSDYVDSLEDENEEKKEEHD